MNFPELIKSPKPILINFHATWCAPCVMMKPHLEEAAKALGDKINYERIDIDKNRVLASTLQIKSLPTTIIYKDGDVKWRKAGLISSSEIVKVVEDILLQKATY